MGFWDIFTKTAHFRISWHLQDIFLNAFSETNRKIKNEEFKRQIEENEDEIIDAIYNNEFTRKRKKPK
mgnify:CR=1 FL=1